MVQGMSGLGEEEAETLAGPYDQPEDRPEQDCSSTTVGARRSAADDDSQDFSIALTLRTHEEQLQPQVSLQSAGTAFVGLCNLGWI